MKRLMIALVLICAAALMAKLPTGPCSAAAETKAEWTVLFYMCGSDLESRYGYATENLRDIGGCYGPRLLGDERLEEALAQHLDLSKLYDRWVGSAVNVLIQTGGCREWHASELGMDIATGALQRWRYRYGSDVGKPGRFTLEQALPLSSMSSPETLSDFIRWGAANYPAEKYAIVLWDHGGGSKTGLFIDELYAGDVMRLNELSSAFRQSGVYFEAVLFDACMMANIETAYAIHEYAHWMVASEELVAGQGTAIDAWLQQLISMPECDGEELGRWICDMTQIKYANLDNKSAQQLMTWSVIDLTKIERVAYYFDILFRGVRLAYQRSPKFVAECAKNIFQSEHYGGSHDNMLDLAGVFYRSTRNSMLSSRTRWEMIDALMDAVVYCVRGSGRAAARGLSFCYATDFLPEELDAYAENCPSANYLSLLDAISPWTAPDRVYKSVRRLPEMDTIDAYRVHVDRVMLEDGTPGFRLDEGGDINVGAVRFRMYRRDENTGVTTALGTAPAYCDTGADPRGVYRMPGFGTWPSIDGEICQIEALSIPMGAIMTRFTRSPYRSTARPGTCAARISPNTGRTPCTACGRASTRTAPCSTATSWSFPAWRAGNTG